MSFSSNEAENLSKLVGSMSSKESGNVEGHREQSKNIKGEGHKEDVR